jgi:large subunit ribosomal protein L18
MSTKGCNRRKRAAGVRYKLKRKVNNRPRLSVFKSNRYIYAQIIDDSCGYTLAAASTLAICKTSAIENDGNKCMKNMKFARALGLDIAARAGLCGVQKVVFDRGMYAYHGCVKELAEGAREGGLVF